MIAFRPKKFEPFFNGGCSDRPIQCDDPGGSNVEIVYEEAEARAKAKEAQAETNADGTPTSPHMKVLKSTKWLKLL